MSDLTLRDLRLMAGMTQEQLAERMETSAVYISQVETGFRRPSINWLRRLSQALGIDIRRVLSALGMEQTEEITAVELAEQVATYPDLVEAFEMGKHYPGMLDDLARYARMVIREVKADYEEQQGEAAPVGNREAED